MPTPTTDFSIFDWPGAGLCTRRSAVRPGRERARVAAAADAVRHSAMWSGMSIFLRRMWCFISMARTLLAKVSLAASDIITDAQSAARIRFCLSNGSR